MVVLSHLTESDRAEYEVLLSQVKKDESKQHQAWANLTFKKGQHHQEICDTRVPFFLPQGRRDDSSTAHIYNLYRGPCALRVSTLTEEFLQQRIFLLKQILIKEDRDGSSNSDHTDIKDGLVDLCMELGVFAQGPLQVPMTARARKRKAWLQEHKPSVLLWESHDQVRFPQNVQKLLGTTWVYLGTDVQRPGDEVDLLACRAYIREIGNQWAAGRPKAVGMGQEPFNWLKRVLEPFDVWMPCTMLDEDCCISDVPGDYICMRVCIYIHTCISTYMNTYVDTSHDAG
jgi:hypothetical protein